jgi:streptogramin lyase
MLFNLKIAAVSLATISLTVLCGCGVSPSSLSIAARGTALTGHLRGGQQPVSGAKIQLYAAGTSGVGTGATDLLAPNLVTTDASGFFNITGDYICPSANTQVYLVARGGNPGLGSGETNPALVLMAALGNCGGLTSTTNVVINEVTTVGAAWALAQFSGANGQVGGSSTNATGLANAFATAANLADSSRGLSPGSALPTGALVETAKLNTLADVLAACVNSDGTTGCAPLFSAATTATGAPTTTLGAALNIVRNPGTNVTAIFSAAPADAPFQPILATAPHDWTISVTYSGGGLNVPGGVAIDSAGNVAVANYLGGVLSKFAPNGTPAAATGIAGAGLSDSYGIAIDASDNIWVTNEQSVANAANHRLGSISEFSSAGAELSGYGYTGGGVYYPLSVAADSNGAIWVADYGDSSATLLNDDGTAVSGGSGYAAGALPFVSAVALDAAHNAWFAAQRGIARVTPAGAVTNYSCCSGPAGIAVDASGNLWVADYTASAVVKLTSAGTVAHTTTINGGNAGPQAIAVDGAGNVWGANYYGNSLMQLAGANAAVVSPATGYGLDAPLSEPYGMAIDAAGNLWLSNSGADTLTELVGLAAPVKTPMLGPPGQP